MSTHALLPTTGIGSLPHHNIDSAIEYSFRFDIPFFPQIPARNPNEFMLAQAMHGLPGLLCDSDGTVTVDVDVWNKNRGALEGFQLKTLEPSSDFASCWRPFLWETIERKAPMVKAQIAGPLTCQWAAKLSDGTPIGSHPKIASQILKLITRRAETMVQSISKTGAHAIFFIDEPALFALDKNNPQHGVALNELKILIGALKKQGATVGLHCCSNTAWKPILELGMDILSVDAALSLDGLLSHKKEFERFIDEGRRLSLGIVSTSNGKHPTHAADLVKKLPIKALAQALLSPACGLAFKTPQECEQIYNDLRTIRAELLKKTSTSAYSVSN